MLVAQTGRSVDKLTTSAVMVSTQASRSVDKVTDCAVKLTKRTDLLLEQTGDSMTIITNGVDEVLDQTTTSIQQITHCGTTIGYATILVAVAFALRQLGHTILELVVSIILVLTICFAAISHMQQGHIAYTKSLRKQAPMTDDRPYTFLLARNR